MSTIKVLHFLASPGKFTPECWKGDSNHLLNPDSGEAVWPWFWSWKRGSNLPSYRFVKGPLKCASSVYFCFLDLEKTGRCHGSVGVSRLLLRVIWSL